MNLKICRLSSGMLLLPIASLHLACTHQDYRLEVVPGQQGQSEVRRVPFTAEEQAARDREEKVRRAVANKSDDAMASDLATLEAMWPRLSVEDKTAILEMAKRRASMDK